MNAHLLRAYAIGTCRVTALQAAAGNYDAGQSSPVVIEVQAVPSIPTLSEWGLLILATMLAMLAGWSLRQRLASVEPGQK